MNNFIKNWGPVVIWTGFIFLLSHQPDLKSGLPGSWDFILRKLAHLTEYFILTLLLIRALTQTQLLAGVSRKKIIFLAIVLSIGYALADEYHQSFIVGRHPALKDIGFDSLGTITAAIYRFLKVKK